MLDRSAFERLAVTHAERAVDQLRLLFGLSAVAGKNLVTAIVDACIYATLARLPGEVDLVDPALRKRVAELEHEVRGLLARLP